MLLTDVKLMPSGTNTQAGLDHRPECEGILLHFQWSCELFISLLTFKMYNFVDDENADKNEPKTGVSTYDKLLCTFNCA